MATVLYGVAYYTEYRRTTGWTKKVAEVVSIEILPEYEAVVQMNTETVK